MITHSNGRICPSELETGFEYIAGRLSAHEDDLLEPDFMGTGVREPQDRPSFRVNQCLVIVYGGSITNALIALRSGTNARLCVSLLMTCGALPLLGASSRRRPLGVHSISWALYRPIRSARQRALKISSCAIGSKTIAPATWNESTRSSVLRRTSSSSTAICRDPYKP